MGAGGSLSRVGSLAAMLGDGPPITLTVNVSARQLAQVDFGDRVAHALRAAGVGPGRMHLEITEGALMHDVSTAWAMLRQAKALGVKLALDDFGTGYSSLSYVRRFSLDMLKIDKSFIDGIDSSPEDRAIVEHVVGMAHALGMVTVAEGVERPEQLVWLRRLGCKLAQGYVLSRPLPGDDLEDLLRRRATDPFSILPDRQPPSEPVIDVVAVEQAVAGLQRLDPGSDQNGTSVNPEPPRTTGPPTAPVPRPVVESKPPSSPVPPTPKLPTASPGDRSPRSPDLPRLREYRPSRPDEQTA